MRIFGDTAFTGIITLKESSRGLPRWLSGKESTYQRRSCRSRGFDPWVGKITLEKGTATHSSILSWEIPWPEEPGGLQSMGWQRVGHDLATKQQQRQSKQKCVHRRSGDLDTQREPEMYTHWGKSACGHLEGGYMQVKDRGLWRNNPCWPLDLRLENCEKIHFYGLSHAFGDALLWQPWQTNTNVILQMTTFATHPCQTRENRRQLAVRDSGSSGQLIPPSCCPVKLQAGEAKPACGGWSRVWEEPVWQKVWCRLLGPGHWQADSWRWQH